MGMSDPAYIAGSFLLCGAASQQTNLWPVGYPSEPGGAGGMKNLTPLNEEANVSRLMSIGFLAEGRLPELMLFLT